MHASTSLFGTMNGGLYTGASGDTLAASVNSFSPIKSSNSSLVDVDISTSPPDLVHHSHHSIHHQLQQHHQQQPLHIPAKRATAEVRSGTASLWPVSGTTPIIGYSPTEPTTNGLSSSITNGNHSNTNGNSTSANNNSNTNNNNNNTSSTFGSSLHESPGSYSSSPPRSTTAATSTTSSLISPAAMATSAYHHGSSSHYPSLSSEIRRPPTAGLVDTKPNVSSTAAAAAAASLNFWQSDYHKYSNPSSCLTPTATDCQASFAAAHQAAAWNYPHPGQYLTSPEQAAAEARRHMDSGFHAADYTRLQYPHDGIYTHPPGKNFYVRNSPPLSFLLRTFSFSPPFPFLWLKISMPTNERHKNPVSQKFIMFLGSAAVT